MATNFGIANNYNLFVLGNMDMEQSHVKGRAASGGNATLNEYEIGEDIAKITESDSDNSLVIGGDLNIINLTNFSGNTIKGTDSNILNYISDCQKGYLKNGKPIDFFQAKTYLTCASLYWSHLKPTGETDVIFGQLTLTGTNKDINIFYIEGDNIKDSGYSFNQLTGINIIVPSDSTVLINILGSNIVFGSYQILINGNKPASNDAKKIVWNFPQAASWRNGETTIYGSVIAPNASAVTTYGKLFGTMIFSSIQGNGLFYNELFTGNLPEAESCKSENFHI